MPQPMLTTTIETIEDSIPFHAEGWPNDGFHEDGQSLEAP